MHFFDAHVHLTGYPTIRPVIEYSRSSETLLLSASVDRETSNQNIELGKLYGPTVKPFVGIHPSEATRATDVGWLEDAVTRATGIGETGLDPRYSEASEGSRQMRLFMAQLQLAENYAKPIQIHSRGAEVKCLEKLSSYRLTKVLLHWFEGEGVSSVASGRGYYISIGPAVLYSKRAARMASSYPEDLTLAESDGPVTFAPLGDVGGPLLIPSVVFAIAELRRKSFGEMAEVLIRNGSAFLK